MSEVVDPPENVRVLLAKVDGTDVSRIVNHHITQHLALRDTSPFWVPFLDIPGTRSMREVLGHTGDFHLKYTCDDSKTPTEVKCNSNGQVRIYFEAEPQGPFLDIKIVTATKHVNGQNANVLADFRELVRSHRERKDGIWLELPNTKPWNVDGKLSVDYKCAGKACRLEQSNVGLSDLRMRAWSPLRVFRSKSFGASTNQAWSDVKWLEEHPKAKIVRVDGFFKNFMFGVQAFYRIEDSKIIPGPKHYARAGYYSYHGNAKEQAVSFKLKEGEFINQVTVRSGEIMDGLQLGTNLGRVQQFGGMGGCHHELGIPPNHEVRAFFGSNKGVLARLGVLSTITVSQEDLDRAHTMIEDNDFPSVLAHMIMQYVGFDLLVE